MDKKDDNAWLRLDSYRNLSKRENPWGLVCALCEKTHKVKDCPHKQPESTSYSKLYESTDDEPYNPHNYGW